MLASLSFTESHLLTPITNARPSVTTWCAIVRSCRSSPKLASIINTVTSANLTASKVSPTAFFSTVSCTRALRLIPAVSKRMTGFSRHMKSTDIESRVTPGSGPTRALSSPRIRFKSVDFPTLGRPIIARRTGLKGSSSASTSISALSIDSVIVTAASLSINPDFCLRSKRRS